ncbi:protein of unknown function [Ralstonia solanacearum PSI07]|nr:protein of unknown function [Ralstonia solanacearum PSI07]
MTALHRLEQPAQFMKHHLGTDVAQAAQMAERAFAGKARAALEMEPHDTRSG